MTLPKPYLIVHPLLTGLLTGLLVAVLLAGLLVGCVERDSRTLWVFAAASLTDAFAEVAQAYEQQHPDIKVRTQFAGSSQLSVQIAAGAPAEVFASANEKIMQSFLASNSSSNTNTATNSATNTNTGSDLNFGESVVFAKNELVLAVARENPSNINGLADLSGKKLAMCDESVPCGSLAQLVAEDFGVELNPSTRETNVRAVLSKLLLGEVDAGLIYLSDAKTANQSEEHVQVISLSHQQQAPQQTPPEVDAPLSAEPVSASPSSVAPLALAPLANYPIVARQDRPEARSFLEFVLSEQGQQIMSAYGFTPVS